MKRIRIRTACFSTTLWAVAVLSSPVAVWAAGSDPGAAITTNLATLAKTNSCRGCDLKGVNLHRGELAGADLEGADLSGARLHLANLAGANLKNAKLQGASFGGADLAGADLRGTDLNDSTLDGAYIAGAIIDDGVVEAKNSGDVEQRPDATEKSASRASEGEDEAVGQGDAEIPVTETVVAPPVAVEPAAAVAGENAGPTKETVQQAADTSDSSAERSVVAAAAPVTKATDDAGQDDPGTVDNAPADQIVAGQPAAEKTDPEIAAEKPNTEAAKPEQESAADAKTALRDQLLDTKKCYGCDLSGMDLAGVNLKNSDLEKANLTDCNLSGAVLRKANLKGADIRNADLRNADLREADFYKADLSGSDLTGADVKGAVFEDSRLTDVVGLVQESVLIAPEDK